MIAGEEDAAVDFGGETVTGQFVIRGSDREWIHFKSAGKLRRSGWRRFQRTADIESGF